MATVTILGAGNMGRGIGTRAVAGGHQVEIVDRDQAEAEKLASELGENATALEQLGFLHISLQQPHGLGFGSTFKLVTP